MDGLSGSLGAPHHERASARPECPILRPHCERIFVDILSVGDVVYARVLSLDGARVQVALEQDSGIQGALLALDNKKIEPPENPMSADRVRWEHIQRIYELCSRNVSETARRLNMHRRTLQRILAKRAPK